MTNIAQESILHNACMQPYSKSAISRGRRVAGQIFNFISKAADPMSAIQTVDLQFLQNRQYLLDLISAGGTKVSAYIYEFILFEKRAGGKMMWRDHPGGELLNFLTTKHFNLLQESKQNSSKIVSVGDQLPYITTLGDLQMQTRLVPSTLKRCLEKLRHRKVIWTEKWHLPNTKKPGLWIFFNWDAVAYLFGEFILCDPVHPFLEDVVASLVFNLRQLGMENSKFAQILRQIAEFRFPPEPDTLSRQAKTAQIRQQQRRDPERCLD